MDSLGNKLEYLCIVYQKKGTFYLKLFKSCFSFLLFLLSCLASSCSFVYQGVKMEGVFDDRLQGIMMCGIQRHSKYSCRTKLMSTQFCLLSSFSCFFSIQSKRTNDWRNSSYLVCSFRVFFFLVLPDVL